MEGSLRCCARSRLEFRWPRLHGGMIGKNGLDLNATVPELDHSIAVPVKQDVNQKAVFGREVCGILYGRAPGK